MSIGSMPVPPQPPFFSSVQTLYAAEFLKSESVFPLGELHVYQLDSGALAPHGSV